MRKLGAASVFFLATLVSVHRCRAENRILDLLLSQGVTIGRDEVVRLPPPTMPDGQSAAEQRKAVERIAQGGHSWEELTRKSAVAPYVLKIDAGKDEKRQTARRIDLWFVLYGDWRTLGSDEFLDKHFTSVGAVSDPEHGSTIRLLTESDLGRTLSNRPGEPRYFAVEFSVLDRVRIRTTTCNVKTVTKESILSASILHPRFEGGREFPEQWRPITRDASGRRQIGPPQNYAGFGVYAKATRLAGLPDAIFVEYHIAFAEPAEWFGGANLLDSKLPLMAQFIVRNLRRDLLTKKKASAVR